MQEIDRRTIEEFKIPSSELMERAGKAVAEETVKLAGEFPKQILILAGKGNNGGDGLAAARYLHQKKYSVQALLFSEGNKLKAESALNFVENARRGISCRIVGQHFAWEILPDLFSGADVIVDALFGIGLNKDLSEPYLSLIRRLNESGRPVVSADIPSGLDADTGQVRGECVRASVTVTFGLPKQGFTRGRGPEFTGKIVVADIGFPAELLR